MQTEDIFSMFGGLNKESLMGELMTNKDLMLLGEKEDGESDAGSDSDPSEDNMEEEEI